jgi:hypothetical protein
MASFITANELRAHKVNGIRACLDAYSDAELLEEIGIVSDMLEWFSGTVFGPTVSTVYFNGSGGHWMKTWPEINAPLISVTSLDYVDNLDVVIDALVEGTDYIIEPYALVKPMRPDLNMMSARVSSGIDSASRWLTGYRNYKALLTYGRATTPAAVKKATKLLTLETIAPKSTGLLRDDIFLQRWEDYTVQYRDSQRTPTPDPSQSLGFAYVDRLIIPYKNGPSMFLDIPNIPSSVSEVLPFSDVDLR